MAIRFNCPACQQPLEIDDGWAGQAVACPYCRRVVTAPQSSSWPSGNVPMAIPVRPADSSGPQPDGSHPASSPFNPAPPPPPQSGPGYSPYLQGGPGGPGFPPPPPPMGYPAYHMQPPTGRSSAGWALALSIGGALALFVLLMVWTGVLVGAAQQKLGPNATQIQLQEEITKQYASRGDAKHARTLAMLGVMAMLANVGGLILAVRSMVRHERGRGMAIAACIIGGLFLFCQVMVVAAIAGPRPTG